MATLDITTSISLEYRVRQWLFPPGTGPYSIQHRPVLHGLPRRLALLLLLALIGLPVPTLAKRTPAPVIEPLFYQGVRYVVPNDKGTVGYVEAWDTATGKKLWKKTIFRKCVIPLLEPDVQWVFIKRMWRDHDRLILVDERKRTYALDLKTRKVRRLNQGPPT